MNKTTTKKHEKQIIEKFKDRKYYCPFCKMLFKKDDKSYLLEHPEKNKPYKCPSCEGTFNRSTYKNKKLYGKHYRLEASAEDAAKLIEKGIIQLWKEGYIIDDIHLITHFSKTKVEEVTNKYRHEVKAEYTLEEFIDYLESDFKKLDYEYVPWRDKRTHRIRKALKMGCSVSTIAKILKMSNTTISNARSTRYITEQRMQQFKEEQKRLENQSKSELSKEESKYVEKPRHTFKSKEEQRQFESFLERAIPISENLNAPERRITHFNTEKNIITIEGREKNKK